MRRPPLQVPATLGRYDLLEFLRSGAMGAIYRGRDSVLGREVAVKVGFVVEPDREMEAGVGFLREAEMAAHVQHPNICCVFDVGIESSFPYLVMELLKGEDLAARIVREGPMRARDMVAILLPTISAVDAAHRVGIVHRDLKPGNIVLANDDAGNVIPKIVDFGVARRTELHEVLAPPVNVISGTLDYLPPECFFGEHRMGIPADVFALGTIAYECLTGAPPHAQMQSQGDLLWAVVRGRGKPLKEVRPDIDETLARIVSRAMHPVPALRIRTAHDLGRALFPFADARTSRRWFSEYGGQ